MLACLASLFNHDLNLQKVQVGENLDITLNIINFFALR